MLYRLKTLMVPADFTATVSLTPRRVMFLIALRRKS
jgi:hypothetical protein